MRLVCPYCGDRDAGEFSYLGDATVRRPNPEDGDADACFYEAIYLRENPCGPHDEFWYHGAGCRSWLRVRRDTRTHAILDIRLASETGAEDQR